MFLPLNFMKIIVLNPKYRIRNNAITPNDILYKFLLLCGTVFCIFLYVYRIIHNFDDNARAYTFLFIQDIAVYADFFFHFTGFIMNFFIVLIYSKNFVQMILIIQNVHRFVNNKVHTKSFIRNNWIVVTVYFITFISYFSYHYVLYPEIPLYVLCTLLVLITFDSDIIYAISLLRFVNDKIEQWNQLVLFDHQAETTCFKKSFEVYLEILKTFDIYKNITQFTVSLVP